MPNLLCRVGLVGVAVVAALLSASKPAGAAGQRSFVSTSGVDNPTCSTGSPCRTFGAAITATSAGGEVIVLDSGGYGSVTIKQSVSVVAPPGVYAGISVSTGDGVIVTTGAGDVVTLRGLTINSIGAFGSGIIFNGAGRLQLTDVSVNGFPNGLSFFSASPSELLVERSSFSGGSNGIAIEGATATDAGAVVLDGIRVHDNSHAGIVLVDIGKVTVRNSVIMHNGYGVGAFPQMSGSNTEVALMSTEVSFNSGQGVWAGDPHGTTAVTIDRCTIVNNGTGVETDAAAQVRLAGTVISRNTTGIAYATGGLALSQGNNLINGNGTDGAAPTIVGSK